MSGLTPRRHHSAGAVVLDGSRCLVIRHGRDWVLPKGHVEPDEPPEEAARREVREETGIEAEIGRRIGATRYAFRTPDGRWNRKRVEWYLGRRTGGDLRLEPIFDEAAFLERDEAIARLTFPADREIARHAFDDGGGSGEQAAGGSGQPQAGRRGREGGPARPSAG